MIRPRYQEGMLYKKGTTPTWYGRFRADVPQGDGTTVRRSRNVRIGDVSKLSKSQAREKLTQMMNQTPAVKMSFESLFDQWQEAVVPTLKDSTAAYYKKITRSHLVPSFGRREVADIKKPDVELFLAQQAQKYSRNTLRGMRASFRRVLQWAKENDWIAKNPVDEVALPLAGKRVTRSILTPEQTIALANKLDEPYRTFVLFLAVSGLRVGEAIGIRWEDFDGDVLHVQRRIYEGKQGELKTTSSDRHLPIPGGLLDRMKSLSKTGWVFQSRDGTPLNPGNGLKRYVRKAARELGISLGGWHDFRHSVATSLLRAGADAKAVAGVLGHSDVKVTLNTYRHVQVGEFRKPLEQIAEKLLPSCYPIEVSSNACAD